MKEETVTGQFSHLLKGKVFIADELAIDAATSEALKRFVSGPDKRGVYTSNDYSRFITRTKDYDMFWVDTDLHPEVFADEVNPLKVVKNGEGFLVVEGASRLAACEKHHRSVAYVFVETPVCEAWADSDHYITVTEVKGKAGFSVVEGADRLAASIYNHKPVWYRVAKSSEYYDKKAEVKRQKLIAEYYDKKAEVKRQKLIAEWRAYVNKVDVQLADASINVEVLEAKFKKAKLIAVLDSEFPNTQFSSSELERLKHLLTEFNNQD